MRRCISLALVVALATAPATLAGDATPQQLVEKFANCVACAPMQQYPGLMKALRIDVFETTNGFLSSFTLSDESLMDEFKVCMAQCEMARAAAMKLPTEEKPSKLCDMCIGMFSLMNRNDVMIEKFHGHLGMYTLATANNPDGTRALHEYAQLAQEVKNAMKEVAAETDTGGGLR